MSVSGERAVNNARPWAERMLFVSGRISLDLAHSGGAGIYQTFERLHTPADLGRWLLISELAWPASRVTGPDLRAAKTLRTAIWNAANAARSDDAVAAEDLAAINAAASVPTLVPQLDRHGQQWRSGSRVASALSSIARDAIDLVARSADLPIRQCARHDCALLFIDGSRPGRRRWCSMERCGTLAKTERFRGTARGQRQGSSQMSGREPEH